MMLHLSPLSAAIADMDYPRAAGRQTDDGCCPLIIAVSRGIYFLLWHPHIMFMANWQKSNFTREPAKTKAELREMLAEAVRNTQPSADHGPKRLQKGKKIAVGAASVD